MLINEGNISHVFLVGMTMDSIWVGYYNICLYTCNLKKIHVLIVLITLNLWCMSYVIARDGFLVISPQQKHSDWHFLGSDVWDCYLDAMEDEEYITSSLERRFVLPGNYNSYAQEVIRELIHPVPLFLEDIDACGVATSFDSLCQTKCWWIIQKNNRFACRWGSSKRLGWSFSGGIQSKPGRLLRNLGWTLGFAPCPPNRATKGVFFSPCRNGLQVGCIDDQIIVLQAGLPPTDLALHRWTPATHGLESYCLTHVPRGKSGGRPPCDSRTWSGTWNLHGW